jgi:hypothetical protein
MAPSTIETAGQPHAAADDRAIAASLLALQVRVESIAAFVDSLRPAAELLHQAPAVAGMVGDSFDALMRTAADNGLDVERGLLNGAEAAVRFGATMNAEKVRELEALLQSGVFDPAALRIVGELARALVATASAQAAPPEVGLVGLLKALRDPDVRRAIGFLVTFAERFGGRLAEPQPSAS